MHLFRWRAVLGLAVWLAMAPVAQAQQKQNVPRIGYIYPAGGKQGTTVDVIVGGQYLEGLTEAFMSGPGVTVKIVEYIKPISKGEYNRLRDKLQALMDQHAEATGGKKSGRESKFTPKPTTRATWTEADDRLVAEIRKKIWYYQRKPLSPVIEESIAVQVTIAADAPPDQRELRFATSKGLTNPLAFDIGQLNEVLENEDRNSSAPAEMSVTQPVVINGQIMPGDVDRYRFKATRGERLVIQVQARDLVPYIPDAVPGWFQATLGVYDRQGKRLAYSDDYRFNPDPVIYFEVPKTDEYVLEIHDSIYRGREDFVYRIAIGEIPFITSIFPLGGRLGSPASVEARGWNLGVARLTPSMKETGVQQLTVRRGGRVSNGMPFQVDTLPEALDKEQNNTMASAQPVTLPILINGRIDQPGDIDVYRFEGKAGDVVAAETYARRLNSPVDSVLKIIDSNGKQVAFNDDQEDKGSGLTTHHADSRLRATLPADGTYYLYMADTQRKGGPEYGYRLRVSPPQHDFDLRVAPSGISVRPGATVTLTVYAMRKDGFAGDIELELKDAPKGFAMSGAVIPGNQEQVRLTLTAPESSSKEPYILALQGKAKIGGQEVVHTAVAAENMMQAFAYQHLVPASAMMVAVTGRSGGNKAAGKVVGETPVKIPSGGTAKLRVALPKGASNRIDVDLSEPPEGMSVKGVTAGKTELEVELAVDSAKIKPGLRGNLILHTFPPKIAGDKRPRQATGLLPAVPFEVVAQ